MYWVYLAFSINTFESTLKLTYMSIGLKNKLVELIGKRITVKYVNGSVFIHTGGCCILIRIDNDDCLVIENTWDMNIIYLPIVKITDLTIPKAVSD